MLGLKGKDLVVSLLTNSLALESGSIEFLCLLACNSEFSTIPSVNSVLVSLFLPHHINCLAKPLVISLDVVVPDQALVKLVLKNFDLSVASSELSSRWSLLLLLSLFLFKLILSRFQLVFENHQTPKNETVNYLCSPNLKVKRID